MTVAGDNPAAAAQLAIDACAELTRRMLIAAEAGEWDTVAELETRRRPCFHEVDLAALDDAELAAAVEHLRALVAMDGRLSRRAAEARQTALEDLRRARGRVQGSARYQQLSYGR